MGLLGFDESIAATTSFNVAVILTNPSQYYYEVILKRKKIWFKILFLVIFAECIGPEKEEVAFHPFGVFFLSTHYTTGR